MSSSHAHLVLRNLTAFAVISTLGFTPSRAQTPKVEGNFGETVNVDLVNIEVWVTDRQGNAVTGLTVDDFEVREDGQPVTISYFDEVRQAGVPKLPIEKLDLVSHPDTSNPDTPTQAAPAASFTPGYLVLYFDELFSGPTGRKRLVRDLSEFLQAQLVTPERVLILKQTEDLRIEAPLGSSRADLEAALTRLSDTTPRGAQTGADERRALREIHAEWERISVLGGGAPGQDPCDYFPSQAFRQVQQHARVAQARVTETLSHLTATASFLAGLPGLKTLVYVSDGLTTTPGTNLLSYIKSVCPGQQADIRLDTQDGLSSLFLELTRHANANRVTIYTVQSLGLRQQSTLTSVDQRGVRNTFPAINRYESETRAKAREGLTFLASETGGRSIFNQNSLRREFEQIATEISGYYSLAYAPSHNGDGLEHKVKIKVRRSGSENGKLRIRHRPGYRDKGTNQRMAERLESTLFLNLVDNPLAVRLGTGQVEPGKGKKFRVPLHVLVPVENLTFLPRQSGEVAKLKVQALAQNERHRRTAFLSKVFEIERPQRAEAEQLVNLPLHLDLGPGIHVVAFGIRDEATQQTSFVSTGLDLNPPAKTPNSGK